MGRIQKETVINDYELSETMKSKVSEWVEYKKEQHKFKYSEQGFKSFIKQLQNYIESCGESNVIKAKDEQSSIYPPILSSSYLRKTRINSLRKINILRRLRIRAKTKSLPT